MTSSKFKAGDKVVLNSHYPSNESLAVLATDVVYDVVKVSKVLRGAAHCHRLTISVNGLDDSGQPRTVEFDTRRFKLAPEPRRTIHDLAPGERFKWEPDPGIIDDECMVVNVNGAKMAGREGCWWLNLTSNDVWFLPADSDHAALIIVL